MPQLVIALALLVGLAAGLLLRNLSRARPFPEGLPPVPGAIERHLGDLAARVKTLEGQLPSLGSKLDSHFTEILEELRRARVEAGRAAPGVDLARAPLASSSPIARSAMTIVHASPLAPSAAESAPSSSSAVAELTSPAQDAPALPPLEIAGPPEASGPPEALLVELWNQHDWRSGTRADAARAFARLVSAPGWRVSEPLSALYILAHREPRAPMFLLPFLPIDVMLIDPALFDRPTNGNASRLITPAEVRFRDQTTTLEQELKKLMQDVCTVVESLTVDRKGCVA